MKSNLLKLKRLIPSIKMVTFSKNANCPNSQDLLAYQNGDILSKDRTVIKRHIETCEFCASELDFYDHVPQSDESVSLSDIPLPLYQLAEALLSNGQKKFSLLNELIGNTEGLTLKKI